MGVARESIVVELEAPDAFRLWTDLTRWPTFMDGFGHVDRDSGWPDAGAKLVWRSRPGGRGVVTERVLELEPPGRLVTQVFEERLSGRQSVEFAPQEGGGTLVAMELDYELTSGGPLRGITDAVFIRRAQSDSLRRTLRRFATEAAEEASL